MSEQEMRRLLREHCEKLDRAARASHPGRWLWFPVALGLSLAACDPTPINLPYMGPGPYDYRVPEDAPIGIPYMADISRPADAGLERRPSDGNTDGARRDGGSDARKDGKTDGKAG